jgi:hypothetical protein
VALYALLFSYLFLGPFLGHFSPRSLLREIGTTSAGLLEKKRQSNIR